MRKTDSRTERKQSVVEPLYTLYYKDMYRYAVSLLKNVYDAEDAVHTVFLRALKVWNTFVDMEESRIKHYLFVSVRNAALDIIRKRERHPEISIEEPEAQERLVTYMTREAKETMEMLYTLPRWHRDILIEAYILGYRSKEIAEKWGMTQNTIEKRIDRAKSAIRGRYHEGKYW